MSSPENPERFIAVDELGQRHGCHVDRVADDVCKWTVGAGLRQETKSKGCGLEEDRNGQVQRVAMPQYHSFREGLRYRAVNAIGCSASRPEKALHDEARTAPVPASQRDGVLPVVPNHHEHLGYLRGVGGVRKRRCAIASHRANGERSGRRRVSRSVGHGGTAEQKASSQACADGQFLHVASVPLARSIIGGAGYRPLSAVAKRHPQSTSLSGRPNRRLHQGVLSETAFLAASSTALFLASVESAARAFSAILRAPLGLPCPTTTAARLPRASARPGARSTAFRAASAASAKRRKDAGAQVSSSQPSGYSGDIAVTGRNSGTASSHCVRRRAAMP